MVSLSSGINAALEELFESDEEARKNYRIVQLEDVFQEVTQVVFKRGASLVLKHVNAVYLFEEKGVKKFVIYSDDSSVRSSLDARREFLKIHLFKQGIVFDEMSILPAQRTIKGRHPFENAPKMAQKPVLRDLTAEEMAEIEEFVAPMENEIVKEAFKQALMSDYRTRTQ